MQELSEIKMKKRVSLVCKGVMLYMTALLLAELAYYGSWELLYYICPEELEAADALDGISSMAAVAFGCVMLWCYAVSFNRDGRLMGEESVLKSIFRRERRISPGTFLSFAAMVYLMQIIFGLFLELLEVLLNGAGMTIMNSPAMNADYTLSPSLLLYAVLIGPIAEEFVFRGFTLKGLKPCGKLFAIVVSALMFSLMHGDIQQLAFTFGAGLLFGYIAMEYSIFVSLALHIFNNGVLSELTFYASEHLPEDMYIAAVMLFILICLIVTVVFLFRKRHKIAEYIRTEQTEPGALPGLLNVWFLLFAALGIAETIFTISPV